MKRISKTQLAARFGVHKSQASRWAAQGMPTNEDGTVDCDEASGWVRRRIDPGARQARHARNEREQDPFRITPRQATDNLIQLGVWLLAQQLPDLADAVALAAGVPESQRQGMREELTRKAPELTRDVCEKMGCAPAERD